MYILVTGAAGFIGMNLCRFLIHAGHDVMGVDNIQDGDDAVLKIARLAHLQSLQEKGQFEYRQIDLAKELAVVNLFQDPSHPDFEVVYHMAASPGIRGSQYHASQYTQNNLVAFSNILEACRHTGVEHLIFASSSSVYGNKTNQSESAALEPMNYYTATKVCNEVMAKTYSENYGMRITAARMFTVFGPWGRPDMAPWIFLDSLINGKGIRLSENGDVERDFTYIDDVVSMLDSLNYDNKDDLLMSDADKFQAFNIGSSFPVTLNYFLELLENEVGKKAMVTAKMLPSLEAFATEACMVKFKTAICYPPQTDLKVAVSRFVEWYQNYHTK